MKIFLKQFLLLGGFYFVISFLFSFFPGQAVLVLGYILLFSWVVLFVILCFKRSLVFLTNFQNKYPKSSLYLMSLGVIDYAGIVFFTILGGIDGYMTTIAEYKGEEYTGIFSQYGESIFMVYAAASILVLLWATYVNFIKKKNV